MATTRTFQDMLNEYLPNDLLREELVDRSYLLNKVKKDNSWLGGNLIVPFEGATASSISFGSLTAAANIAEAAHVRGSITSQPEMWGSMVFNERDLMEHKKLSPQNFLKILPGEVNRFMDVIKSATSVNMLSGSHFATTTDASSSASGLLVVDRPDRFIVGQLVTLDDGSDNDDVWVTAIDMNTKTVTFSATSGGAAVDLNALGHDSTSTKAYHPGADDSGASFTSLRNSLLSAANGGSSTLYGQTKTAYPYLQAINVDGSSITAVNIMEKIFDALTDVRQLGKGAPNTVVMSYKNFGSCIKNVEVSKGDFNVTPGSRSASQYGWTEIEIGSVAKGGLSLAGVQEMDDDVIFILDWRALKFYSNGMFKKRRAPDGKEYFETRNTTGYTYIVDLSLFGDLVLLRPSSCGVIHSVSY